MIFADTHYYIALLNERDADHDRAVEFARTSDRKIITTDWVLVELGNACSSLKHRKRFVAMFEIMQQDESLTIVEASRHVLTAGMELFTQRPDKTWSLTDCISFVMMEQYGVVEALTADQHFEQAGFAALLI